MLPNFNLGLHMLATTNSGSWKWLAISFMCLSHVSKCKINTNLMLIGGNVADV